MPPRSLLHMSVRVFSASERILLLSGSELFAVQRRSRHIRVFAAATADHPKPTPVRTIQLDINVFAVAVHAASHGLFVGGIGADNRVRVSSFDARSGQKRHSTVVDAADCIAVGDTQVFCGGVGGAQAFSIELVNMRQWNHKHASSDGCMKA